jgi:hypothetical protein
MKARNCGHEIEQPMINAQEREWVESIGLRESPVPIQQATVCASRYFGPEAEVLEFFLRGQGSLCRLSGERWSSHLERIGSGVSGRSKNGP